MLTLIRDLWSSAWLAIETACFNEVTPVEQWDPEA